MNGVNADARSDGPGDDLDDRLRSMILGNVRIGQPDDTPRDIVHSPRGRGRGRGRGFDSPRKDESHVTRSPNLRARARNSQPAIQVLKRGEELSSANGDPRREGTLSSRGRGDATARGGRGAPSRFTPLQRAPRSRPEEFNAQCMYLEELAARTLPEIEMSPAEWQEKDNFRRHLERICLGAVDDASLPRPPFLQLISFGSLSSGFAMPGSDMDLALVTDIQSKELPRILEKAILKANIGARLLTRTRVPILKVCERPYEELFSALVEARAKWDAMTPAEKEEHDYPPPQEKEKEQQGADKSPVETHFPTNNTEPSNATVISQDASKRKSQRVTTSTSQEASKRESQTPSTNGTSKPQNVGAQTPRNNPTQNHEISSKPTPNPRKPDKPWYRERRLGPLDFPKTGVGIQCDINFSTALGLHNTLLLRCYSHCDIRVRLMVLFVKTWASRRKINSSYNGTLSSYGYVLMVLHFLVNVCRPPVCPNLQLARRTDPSWQDASNPLFFCDRYDVQFWRDERELQSLAAAGQLTQNREPLGVLLRQFFHYYAQQGPHVLAGGFIWTMHTLSLRTRGGVLTKEQKGWTGAKTTTLENREVRHRYLFAIEDPFELDHNVARTVTHNGIVAIRDEFRRARRVINAHGCGQAHADADLLERIVSVQPLEEEKGREVSATSDEPSLALEVAKEVTNAVVSNGRGQNDVSIKDA